MNISTGKLHSQAQHLVNLLRDARNLAAWKGAEVEYHLLDRLTRQAERREYRRFVAKQAAISWSK